MVAVPERNDSQLTANVTSNSSIYDPSYCRYNNTLSISVPVKVVILCVLLLIGPLCNILIIFLVCYYKKLRRSINYLITNMAASDLLALVLGVPQWLDMTLSGSTAWRLTGLAGSITCKLYYFLLYCAPLVSLVTLLIISAERYRAVTRTSQTAPTSTRQISLMIAISWIIPIVLFSSSLYFFDLIDYYGIIICTLTTASVLTSLQYVIIQTVTTVLLFAIMIILNVLILKKLRHTKTAVTLPESQRRRRKKRFVRAVRMVLCSLFLYTVCMLPANLLELIQAAYWYFTKSPLHWAFCIDWDAVNFTIYFLFYLNFTFSPFIYLVFLEDFQSSLKQLLGSRRADGDAMEDTIALQAQQTLTTYESPCSS